MPVVFFESIIISSPTKEIYSRLGYAKGLTKLDVSRRDDIERSIDLAQTFVDLKGAAIRLPIISINPSCVSLSDGLCLESKALARLLRKSSSVLFMGATAGKRIMNAIKRRSSGRDMTAAVVFDAVASEMVDAALDWIMNYYNRELRRENRHLTRRRFSAGYGDFSLDHQKIMCKVLKMKQLGITLTRNKILVPEKSVTAVAGIE